MSLRSNSEVKMPKSNSRNQNNDRGNLNHSKVVKGGAYGRVRSSDFAVSGHSTGAATTEMEALSHQVSRDAGQVPAYETDGYRSQTYRDRLDTASDSVFGGEVRDFDPEFAAGPLLYGDKPSLLQKNPSAFSSGTSSALKLWLPVGILAGAIASYAGYRAYQNYKYRPIFPKN